MIRTFADLFNEYPDIVKKRLTQIQNAHEFSLQNVVQGYEMYKIKHPDFREPKQTLKSIQDSRTITIPYDLFQRIVVMKKDIDWNDILEEWYNNQVKKTS